MASSSVSVPRAGRSAECFWILALVLVMAIVIGVWYALRIVFVLQDQDDAAARQELNDAERGISATTSAIVVCVVCLLLLIFTSAALGVAGARSRPNSRAAYMACVAVVLVLLGGLLLFGILVQLPLATERQSLNETEAKIAEGMLLKGNSDLVVGLNNLISRVFYEQANPLLETQLALVVVVVLAMVTAGAFACPFGAPGAVPAS